MEYLVPRQDISGKLDNELCESGDVVKSPSKPALEHLLQR
jgi:hypothetical protein